MPKKLKGFALSFEPEKWTEFLKNSSQLQESDVDWTAFSSKEELEKSSQLTQFDFGVARGPFCLQLGRIVKRRSVGSHFLKYIDFVKVEKGDLWGRCLFFEVLEKVIRTHIRTQDYKGSVIFLGDSPLIYPSLGVLSQFGFNDFVFLNLHEENESTYSYQDAVAGLFDVKTATVNSDAFIQSQKEYSLCFVLEDFYSQQTLEDMSYFHFLSGNSMVFDLAGESNFLFEEVKALGVEVIKSQEFSEVYTQILADELKKCLQK